MTYFQPGDISRLCSWMLQKGVLRFHDTNVGNGFSSVRMNTPLRSPRTAVLFGAICRFPLRQLIPSKEAGFKLWK